MPRSRLRSSPAWNGRCWSARRRGSVTRRRVAILTGLEWPVLVLVADVEVAAPPGCDPHRLGMAGAGFPPPYRFFRETYSCDPHRLGMAGAGRPRYRCVAAEYMLRSSPAWNGRCWAPPPAVEDTMPKVAILTGLEWPVLGPAACTTGRRRR